MEWEKARDKESLLSEGETGGGNEIVEVVEGLGISKLR